jgi:uncharacterized membrane protein YkoI
MTPKRLWQTALVALLVGATGGTVALAADTLSSTALPSGLQVASEHESGNDSRTGTAGDWMSLEDAMAAVTAAGYSEVREIERDEGNYEVKARDAEGRLWELYLDGRTGEILKRERD